MMILHGQLEQSEEECLFQHSVKAAPYAMLIADGERRILAANQQAEALFGYSSAELAGQDIETLIPVRHRTFFENRISTVIAQPPPHSLPFMGELFGKRKDGSELPIEISLSSFETSGKRYILTSVLDISKRRYHEEALRLAVEAAPNVMLLIDESGTIVLVNRAAEELFGYSRDELLNKPVQILVPERLSALDEVLVAKFLVGPSPRFIRAAHILFGRRKDGTDVPVEMGLNVIETPRGRFILVAMVDVTEQRHYEEELRRSQREAIEDKRRAEDRAFLLLHVWDEIVSLAIRCELPGAYAARAQMMDAYQDPAPVEGRLVAILTTFENAFCGYVDANRTLAAHNQALAKAKAVTEAANRELEAFSYSVAHDLRSPLRSVGGFCQILDEEYSEKLDETGRNYLSRVRRAAQHMGTLIDDLLNLARITQGDLARSAVNLSQIATQIADSLRDRAPERAVYFTIAKDLVVNGDPRLLRVVLENLFSNAWKFTATQPAARIDFGAEFIDGQTAFYIRDNGVGFEMAHAAHLFRAFQRLHNVREFPGTGIGLATVQRIINKHGGRIWAKAAPGKGATFFFVL
jgi:PAS domain S-box-containing protein